MNRPCPSRIRAGCNVSRRSEAQLFPPITTIWGIASVRVPSPAPARSARAGGAFLGRVAAIRPCRGDLERELGRGGGRRRGARA